MDIKIRLLRVTTVPISLKLLLHGQLGFFQKQGYDVLAVSADGPEIDALTEEGIDHQIVAMTRKITPLQDLKALIALIKVIHKFKPTIVHSHTPKAGLLAMIAAWLCRVPVRLHTVAGLPLMEASGVKRKILIFTEQLTYFFSTKVYVNSGGLMQFIQQHVSRQKKFSMIGRGSSNGINTERFARTPELEDNALAIREQHHIAPADIVFSFVGRVVKDKGMREIIYAFKKIVDAFPEQRFYFLIVGPFEQDLDPLSPDDYNYLTKEKRIVLPGFQHDVRPWIMASDIFVFPSYREGFPNVVMQASCLGVPCVVSDINGCNEIVQHGVTGLIVPAKDGEALLNAMTAMVKRRAELRQWADRARDFVAGNFDQRYIWEQLQRAYETELGLKNNV